LPQLARKQRQRPLGLSPILFLETLDAAVLAIGSFMAAVGRMDLARSTDVLAGIGTFPPLT
jgi:hypothetical protein